MSDHKCSSSQHSKTSAALLQREVLSKQTKQYLSVVQVTNKTSRATSHTKATSLSQQTRFFQRVLLIFLACSVVHCQAWVQGGSESACVFWELNALCMHLVYRRAKASKKELEIRRKACCLQLPLTCKRHWVVHSSLCC